MFPNLGCNNSGISVPTWQPCLSEYTIATLSLITIVSFLSSSTDRIHAFRSVSSGIWSCCMCPPNHRIKPILTFCVTDRFVLSQTHGTRIHHTWGLLCIHHVGCTVGDPRTVKMLKSCFKNWHLSMKQILECIVLSFLRSNTRTRAWLLISM